MVVKAPRIRSVAPAESERHMILRRTTLAGGREGSAGYLGAFPLLNENPRSAH
jgi:hypothetical protein